ncbi:MAG: hypothetical protein FJX21_02835, partial [Alphaproteobacteria bacterium]|nr:hypothetical protein [Alphaproteobacteria bacterium]
MREAVLPALRWTALGRLGAQALSLAATLVVVRILGPSEYGLFALCMAPVTFLGALVVVAPSSLVIRANAPRRDTRRATGLLVALAGLATLAMVPASVAIAWSRDDPRTLPLAWEQGALRRVLARLRPELFHATWNLGVPLASRVPAV